MMILLVTYFLYSAFSDLCTFTKTGETMTRQKLYQCATCNMVEGGYCICQICIKTCHEGHNIVQKTYKGGFGLGFCDCGEEGSRGVRPCKMLKGIFFSFVHYSFSQRFFTPN